MQQRQTTIKALISYKGTLETGEVFDEIPDSNPQLLHMGTGACLPAFEEAMVGMLPGERRTIQIPAEYGFGVHKKELVQTFDRAIFGEHAEIKPGMILFQSIEKDGKTEKVPCTVVAADEESVTVDYNHPLAGKVLTYEITLHDLSAD